MQISYPPGLPVSEKRAEIATAIRENQVVVVAGETGSGKTTQLPKICLELGLGEKKLIGHTQPRRLAARSVASRIAEELNTTLGKGVGYQVRFSDTTSPDTRIKLMTDGILLAEIQQDKLLSKYDVIIVDEAHERSLNIDFLLGYLKQLLSKRSDLKLIITSATIDVDKFSEHFSAAPVISVSGRSYPVEIIYQDPAELEVESEDDRFHQSVIQALQTLKQHESKTRQPPGDVLVFLSGERDIRELALTLRQLQLPDTEIIPLYARLTQNEQQRIFMPHRGRRIILATNVAETSLTVPGIRYVIDSGLARISRYSVQSKVQRLPVEPISQASANQRAGRCGRVASGICVRLYSENDFLNRPPFTDPEIKRTNLSAVILQMLLLNLGEVESFPFIEPPERRAINDGFRVLEELGAIDANRILTPRGRQMARLPTDPRLACMLVESSRRHCLYDLLIIVSALSIQDPRDTPTDKKQAARQRHAQYADKESDFLSWIRLWHLVELERQALSSSQFRKYCSENYLSWLRLREWRETHRQLMLSCQQQGLKLSRPADEDLADYRPDYEATHRSMLPGALNQIGQRSQDGLYATPRGRKFSIFPSSVLARKQPRWVMSAELIETSRVFATQVARIEPNWVVDAAAHLLRREYFDAHWEKKRGEVVAYEKLSLFGLTLIERRRVSYSKIDPQISRQIFIYQGLLAGDIQLRAPFYAHNQQLLEKYRKQEEKERRPDIVVPDEVLAEFYEQRLPPGINSVATLERWSRKQKDPQHTSLHMREADILARDVDVNSQLAYPDLTNVLRNSLKISYQFQPGSERDGASIAVPLTLISQMSQQDLDWAVPGLLQERCVALVKSLPKSIRKQLVPAPEFVEQALKAADAADKPVLTALLAEQAWQQRRVRVPADAWDESTVPVYLRPTVCIIDANGKELARGHVLADLQSRFAGSAKSQKNPSHGIEQNGLKDWKNFELPEVLEVKEQGIRLLRYPALRDDSDSVAIVLCDTQSAASRLTERGLARLYMFRTAQQRELLANRLKNLQKSLGLKLLSQNTEWPAFALLTVYRLAFATGSVRPHDSQSFQRQLDVGKADLVATGDRLFRLLQDVYSYAFSVEHRLKSLQARFPDSIKDIRHQLELLIPDHFPDSAPSDWIWEYPRYLKALDQRLDKLPSQAEKDRQLSNMIASLQKDWQRAEQLKPGVLADFQWWLQELRVSSFAQQLGTKGPVSEKRLRKQLEKVG
ncbi:ATP-dependent RNA helicase HrpA [Pseudohongiella spirulinae]|uniref:ATP-dependent helicase HrpA n=1 Tax=Pseudohongiella spirulinae TaxID=1249552 RepID=A0A0S2KD17_9GAMM|nr:ATP-dependent RNA helicase HrpA [Pseudohongiella spirulinae]ALO46137.1 ATP-dependent helicase HrpA [Pseudohongiella spirulinae]